MVSELSCNIEIGLGLTELEQSEQNKYQRMWDLPKYSERSPGMRVVDSAFDLLGKLVNEPIETVIDIGAGTGRVSNHIRSVYKKKVYALDIAQNSMTEFHGTRFYQPVTHPLPSIARAPGKASFDFGFCADVMEHIPPAHVETALENIARATRFTYFQIANFVCHEGDEIGESLHLTVRPFAWWANIMAARFRPIYMEEANKHHIFLAVSRYNG